MKLFKIGEFSRINCVTLKTLRHYEEIGLIKPAVVDSFTGYRSYSMDQLSVMAEILEYKQMGFSLEEIKMICACGPTPEQIAIKSTELSALKAEIDDKLSKLASYQKKSKGDFIMKTIEIKSLPACTVVSHRCVMKSYDDLFHLMPNVIGPEMKRLGCICAVPEYCFNIYHDGEYREQDIDVEICEAVTEKKQDTKIIAFKTLDAVKRAVCIKHIGPYSTLGSTYAQVFGYIEKEGLTIAGETRESYIDGIWNKSDPREWVTEIQIPLK